MFSVNIEVPFPFDPQRKDPVFLAPNEEPFLKFYVKFLILKMNHNVRCSTVMYLIPGQYIWNKIGKSDNTEQDKKSLVSTSACFFDCYCKSLISGKETGRSNVSTQI